MKANYDIIKRNYDKLLHVTVSFTLLVWLSKITTSPRAAMIVFIACLIKTVWNYRGEKKRRDVSKRYSPFGDWVANCIGFGLWVLYSLI